MGGLFLFLAYFFLAVSVKKNVFEFEFYLLDLPVLLLLEYFEC